MPGFNWVFVCVLALLSVRSVEGGQRRVSLAVPAKAIQHQLVASLDQLEDYDDAQLFHSGLLWSGRSVLNLNPMNRLEIYRPGSSTMVDSVILPHIIQFIRPYGANTVVAVGYIGSPVVTFYTEITFNPTTGKLESPKIHQFPIDYQGEDFAGDPKTGAKYFADVKDGGVFIADSNFDTAVTTPYSGHRPTQEEIEEDYGFPVNPFPAWRAPRHPSRAGDYTAEDGIETSFDSPNFLAPRVRGPHQMLLIGDALFVVEHMDSQGMASNLAKIDLKTERLTNPFQTPRRGLARITQIPGTRLVAAVERGANKVLFIDAKPNKLVASINVPGTPWDISTLGHCAVVLSRATSQLVFIDVRMMRKVAQWDVAPYIDRFHRPKSVAVDPDSGTVFVRSVEACPRSNCATSFNDTRSFKELAGSTRQLCK